MTLHGGLISEETVLSFRDEEEQNPEKDLLRWPQVTRKPWVKIFELLSINDIFLE